MLSFQIDKMSSYMLEKSLKLMIRGESTNFCKVSLIIMLSKDVCFAKFNLPLEVSIISLTLAVQNYLSFQLNSFRNLRKLIFIVFCLTQA